MKRVALIILVLSAALAAQAHHPNHRSNRGYATARIYADGPFDIQVSIDGYLVNRRPGEWVDLGSLAPGRYVIGVKAYGPRQTKYTKQVIHIRPGYRTEYAVFSNGRRSPLVLSREAMIPIGRPVRHQQRSHRGRY
ncbi:MAG: hypothetical protein RIF33_21825 [Cyclobacteriaceae bacterium]